MEARKTSLPELSEKLSQDTPKLRHVCYFCQKFLGKILANFFLSFYKWNVQSRLFSYCTFPIIFFLQQANPFFCCNFAVFVLNIFFVKWNNWTETAHLPPKKQQNNDKKTTKSTDFFFCCMIHQISCLFHWTLCLLCPLYNFTLKETKFAEHSL